MFHSSQEFDRDLEDNWSKYRDPCTYQIEQAPHDVMESNLWMARLRHQVDVVNNIIRASRGEVHHGTRQAGIGAPPVARKRHLGMHSASHSAEWPAERLGTRPTHNAYNSGLTNNSCFSYYNERSKSRHDSRSTLFSKTYNSQLPLQVSNDELIFEDFIVNQTKINEEILGRLNSLSSKFNNLATYATQLEKMLETEIVQETCSSYRSPDEQNGKMTLQGNEELESFSSLKEIAICYETDSDDGTQFETNEKQEKIEEPKYVVPPPNVFPIFIPLRLTYIDKSNELELKDPPIVSIIDESEKKEDGGNPLKVEASDVTNGKFTKFDLSSQLEKCLENTKHVSRISLNHFWKNYDAFTGRKVKIR